MIEYKRNKRKNDPKYCEKDIEYKEKYKSSGRQREKCLFLKEKYLFVS